MVLALHVAASGMRAQQDNLNTITNNISNVNTNGFKRVQNEFQDLIYQNVKTVGDTGSGNSNPGLIQMGNGSRLSGTSRIQTQGQLSQTERELDIAIDGIGFFEVEMPDGTTTYTRDGSFHVNASGQVVTSDGYIVKNNFGSIPKDMQSLFISETGQATLTSASGETKFQISITRFQNPSGLQSIGSNLYKETIASGTPETGSPKTNGFGGLRQGYTEGSNVNLVQEMVSLITAQRAYEVNSKSIQTADQMLSQINSLKM